MLTVGYYLVNFAAQIFDKTHSYGRRYIWLIFHLFSTVVENSTSTIYYYYNVFTKHLLDILYTR